MIYMYHASPGGWEGSVRLLVLKPHALKKDTNNFWGQVISILSADLTVGRSRHLRAPELSGVPITPARSSSCLVVLWWSDGKEKQH